MMSTLHEESLAVVEQLHAARLELIRLTLALKQAEYDLALAKARIERAWIKKVGDEKKIGPTTEDRERVFILARDTDEDYRTQYARYTAAYEQAERGKAEVATLHDKLAVMLAALRSEPREV